MKLIDKLEDSPRVGVALIIRQAGRLLLGRRRNQPMAGSWQLPGGWLHLAEAPEQAVARQLEGFSGADFSQPQFVAYTNNVFTPDMHSLSLYFMSECIADKRWPSLLNADCSDWRWACWDDLPEPLFLPLQLLRQSGYNPFDR